MATITRTDYTRASREASRLNSAILRRSYLLQQTRSPRFAETLREEIDRDTAAFTEAILRFVRKVQAQGPPNVRARLEAIIATKCIGGDTLAIAWQFARLPDTARAA